MKFNVTKDNCSYCPKCGKFVLNWSVCFAEELCYSASCPSCGLFFANELSNFYVHDSDD